MKVFLVYRNESWVDERVSCIRIHTGWLTQNPKLPSQHKLIGNPDINRAFPFDTRAAASHAGRMAGWKDFVVAEIFALDRIVQA